MHCLSERIAVCLGNPQSRENLLAAVAKRQKTLAELGRVDFECQLARDQGRLASARFAYERVRELELRLESV